MTAGNSSGINDGAAAVVIASEERAAELGIAPMGAFGGSAVAGVDPRVMGIGPVPAVRRLLARTGLTADDLDLVELNEAFASQSLAVVRELGLDEAKVNVNGGAIAIGHPLGMSGARLVVSLLHELRRRGGGRGIATMCVGVGQGQAALFEVAVVTHAERYLELGLRLGRHVDGLVDSYYGPPELKEQTDSEPVVAASQLAADAETLLGELPDGWLRDQVRGCATYARVLAGDDISYSDEVEQCYGVRPVMTDAGVYEAAHAELDDLLPGDGSLFERRQAWRTGQLVDGALALAVLDDLLPLLRERTEAIVPLPVGEQLTLEPVQDEPWWAFNYYLGDLREPGRPEPRRADDRLRPGPPGDPRGVSGAPHGACAQGAAAAPRPRRDRGGTAARADAPGAPQ